MFEIERECGILFIEKLTTALNKQLQFLYTVYGDLKTTFQIIITNPPQLEFKITA